MTSEEGGRLIILNMTSEEGGLLRNRLSHMKVPYNRVINAGTRVISLMLVSGSRNGLDADYKNAMFILKTSKPQLKNWLAVVLIF